MRLLSSSPAALCDVSATQTARPPIDQPDVLPPGSTPRTEVLRLCPWKVSFILLAIATVIGTMDALVMYFFGRPAGRPPPSISYTLAVTYPGWYVLLPMTPLVLWMADRFPLGPGRWRRALLVHVPAGMLFVLVWMALATWLCDFVFAPMTPEGDIPITMERYVANLRRVIGRLFTYCLTLYWVILGAHHTLFYLRRALQRDREAADLALRASRLETGLAHANLRALSMQLQPHFLFNTLNAISVLAAKGERVHTVRMIGRLSELLRMALGNTAQTVPLASELEFAQRYLDIEQVRFNDRLSVRFDVAPDTLGAQVPSMILQPLVENAIKHGIARRRGAGRVEVRSRRAADTLELAVRDDGPGFGGAPHGGGTGVGLVNTRARLEQLYGADGFEMYRGDAPGGGALVRITFPFRTASAADGGEAAAVPVIALEAV